MGKDYYKILGIEKSASADDIKRSFRKLAHEHHPDKNGGNGDKFKEINEAYQTLGDEKKRAQYDQFGSAYNQAGGAGGFNWQDFAQGGGAYQNVNIDFGDIFGDIFGFGGGGGRQAQSQRGNDIQTQMHLTFEESIFGTTQDITLDKVIGCTHCEGSGAEKDSKEIECGTCKGSGQVVFSQNVLFGQVQSRKVCSDCRGKGKKPEKVCTECTGTGVKRGSESISVKIPAGVRSGEVIRLTGKGNAAPYNGHSGYLYITLQVEESPVFKREGDDIYTDEKIQFSQAIFGDKIKIKTVDNEVTLKIPAGTQSETIFRLKGYGVAHLKGHGRGDHYVKVQVDVPKKLTKEQKKLVKELQEKGL